MENKKMEKAEEGVKFTAAKKGILALVFALLISASIITITYLPWNEHKALEKICTEPTTATVDQEGSQEKDGVYFYGPVVRFSVPGRTIGYRVEVMNTVNLNKTWKEGEPLPILYSPSDPTQVIFRDDHAAENHYRAACIGSGILCAAGVVMAIAGGVVTIKKRRPTKFTENAAGQSFEEWQAEQLEKKENSDDKDDTNDTDDTEKAETTEEG